MANCNVGVVRPALIKLSLRLLVWFAIVVLFLCLRDEEQDEGEEGEEEGETSWGEHGRVEEGKNMKSPKGEKVQEMC